MIQAQTADGVIHQFPDGTDPAVIDRAMKSYTAQIAPQLRANADAAQRAANTPGIMRAINNGFAFNAAGNIDALGAAAETGIHNAFAHFTGQPDSGYGMKEAFNAVRGAEANASNAFAQAHPVQNIAANVIGAVANPVNKLAGGYVAKAATLPAAVGRSVGTGAALGAAYGAGGTQPGQKVSDTAAQGAVIGGAVGAAAPVVESVAGSVARSVARATGLGAKSDTAPAVQALKDAKTAAYKTVDDMGAAYTPQAATDLASGIKDELTAANISPTRHPKAYSMMQDLQTRLTSGKPVSMTDLDQIRQEIRRDVANGRNDPAEQFFGQKMIQNIDEFVDSAGKDQMVNGDAQGVASAIKTARDLNTRYRKAETIQNALDSADLRAASTGSGGNANNATRQKLRPFIDPQSRKQLNLTPEEDNLLQQTVRGTAVQNALRQVGKLSPEGNGLMMAGHLGAGLLSHGTSVPVAIAGLVAKHIADAQTQQNVSRLIQMIAQGAPGAERQLQGLAARNPGVAALYRDLINAAPGVAASAAAPRGTVTVQLPDHPEYGVGVSRN